MSRLSVKSNSTGEAHLFLSMISIYESKIKELDQEIKKIYIPQRPAFTPEELRTASEIVLGTLEKPVEMWRNEKYECK